MYWQELYFTLPILYQAHQCNYQHASVRCSIIKKVDKYLQSERMWYIHALIWMADLQSYSWLDLGCGGLSVKIMLIAKDTAKAATASAAMYMWYAAVRWSSCMGKQTDTQSCNKNPLHTSNVVYRPHPQVTLWQTLLTYRHCINKCETKLI